MSNKVALVTGANSGVGFGLCNLLAERGDVTVIMACRNPEKAKVAKDELLEKYPQADIEFLKLDLEDLSSVLKACDEVKKKWNKLDWIFCNAGIMPNQGMSFSTAAKNVILHPHYTFETGGDIIVQTRGEKTSLGLGKVFMANVFGHYVLIRQLMPLLIEAHGRAIWTSSTTAYPPFFSLEDLQHVEGPHPYESSKRCVDLLSIALNKQWKDEGKDVKSIIASPGDLPSNLFKDAMPGWVFNGLVKPLYYALGFVGPVVGLSGIHSRPETAAYSLLYCATEEVDCDGKYHSECTSMGKPWVKQLKVQEGPWEKVLEKMETLYSDIVEK